jgi:purine-nucleoside phosphorylase
MLRTLGADVVGMSTVPEAIVARQAGMEVLGIALVSNAAAGVLGTPITHEEVLEAGREAAPRLAALIESIVARIGDVVAPAR